MREAFAGEFDAVGVVDETFQDAEERQVKAQFGTLSTCRSRGDLWRRRHQVGAMRAHFRKRWTDFQIWRIKAADGP